MVTGPLVEVAPASDVVKIAERTLIRLTIITGRISGTSPSDSDVGRTVFEAENVVNVSAVRSSSN